MTTISANSATVKQSWYLVDAEGLVLGRLASAIATRLRGKHKPEYTPHVDTGDYIVVINADKVVVTGNKSGDKMYHSHSNFPGGIKSVSFEKLMEKDATRAIELAVKGMMPRNPLGREMRKKLKIYAGSAHPHTAQQPEPIKI